MKIRDAMKFVEEDGPAIQTRTEEGRVTIAGHPSKDLDPKTFRSILKQAGLR
ncbi:MAG: type II toxin-antitoxin system HicA family toxin [Acidobacteriia bacterium]|nr:type II toxin-antitoxin system HicA family toxin [Terriglobia bacterium]